VNICSITPPHVELDDIPLHAEAQRADAVHLAERVDHLGRIQAQQAEHRGLHEIERRDAREPQRAHQQPHRRSVQRGAQRGESAPRRNPCRLAYPYPLAARHDASPHPWERRIYWLSNIAGIRIAGRLIPCSCYYMRSLTSDHPAIARID